MLCVFSALPFIPMLTGQESRPRPRDGGGGHDEHGGGGYGHEVSGGGGYGGDDHGGGDPHGGGGGGGYGHESGGGYKPQPPKKCHPQTITKYKTIYKDRKANVYNQVEVLNPQPHVKKIKETRDTTIRYPVFITQVIKPLLTQVETKVKPIFFTKTINKYTTVLFTVTGIGQVTVTSVKYEKEYITRCQKKGYGHHRREYGDEDGPQVRHEENSAILETRVDHLESPTQTVLPPPGIPYDAPVVDPYIVRGSSQQERGDSHLGPGPAPRVPSARPPVNRRRPSQQRPPVHPPRKASPQPRYPHPPRSSISPMFKNSGKTINRSGSTEEARREDLPFKIGNVKDLYMEDIYYYDNVDRSGRVMDALEPSQSNTDTVQTQLYHPTLDISPIAILF